MTPFEELYRHIRPFAPSAPDPTIDDAIRYAAIEFCEATRCHRFRQRITLSGRETEVVVTPAQADIFEIEEVWFGEKKLDPLPHGETGDDTNWPTDDSTDLPQGGPKYYSQAKLNTLTIIPRSSGVVRVSIFCKPNAESDALDDEVARMHGIRIAEGAVSRLATIPGQPYTNGDIAAIYGAKFQRSKDSFFDSHVSGQQRAPARSKYGFM